MKTKDQIPYQIDDWFAKGTVLLRQSTLPEYTWRKIKPPIETTQIAIGVSCEIGKWGKNIVPAIYVPDGTTQSPANHNGRVIIIVYKMIPTLSRLGSIIFENGSATVYISKFPYKGATPRLASDINGCSRDHSEGENAGSFDLSDPDFPATIFQPFQSSGMTLLDAP
jgi:hypothetical protein